MSGDRAAGERAVRRLLWSAAIPVVLVVVGTTGYSTMDGWSVFDALYMSIITLTTVGYLEVQPLTQGGRVFTMFLAMGGVFTLFFTAGEVLAGVANGEFRAYFDRRRMEHRLDNLRAHFIVCGYGRMGRRVCREFASQGLPFVVIERDAETLAAFEGAPDSIAIVGDATTDAVLRQVRVEKARALVALLGSDADNLYITMSARLLNKDIKIVSRGESEEAETKLLRAGATRVVSPYAIGGSRIAQAAIRPTVVDFLELATEKGDADLNMEELGIADDSALVGRELQHSGIRQQFGVIVVAVRRPDGEMVFNPAGTHTLEAGERLVVLGHAKGLIGLSEAAGTEKIARASRLSIV